MKEGKYSVMIVEDQQMPKALFSHFVESSDKFYLEVAIENATVADIICAHTPIDLIVMDVVTENGESGLDAAEKIKNCSYEDASAGRGIRYYYKVTAVRSVNGTIYESDASASKYITVPLAKARIT